MTEIGLLLLLSDVNNETLLYNRFYLGAMFISLLWIILMRWLAGVMVWLTIVLFVGVFGFCKYYLP